MIKIPEKVDDCLQMRSMMTVFLTAKVCDEVIKVVNVVNDECSVFGYFGICVFVYLCVCVFLCLCIFVFVVVLVVFLRS